MTAETLTDQFMFLNFFSTRRSLRKKLADGAATPPAAICSAPMARLRKHGEHHSGVLLDRPLMQLCKRECDVERIAKRIGPKPGRFNRFFLVYDLAISPEEFQTNKAAGPVR